MGLSLEFFESTGTTVAAGIFIPASDIVGISAGEFADAVPTETKESKFVFGFLNTLVANNPSNALGLSIVKGNPTGAGTDLINILYTVTAQYYADLDNKSVGMIPIPATGDNSGIGDVSIDTIFANATKVAASASITEEGVLIPTANVEPYGSPAHASLDVSADSRDWLSALMLFISNNANLRTTSVASAITARSSNNLAAVTLPAAATDATNPTTGFDAADLPKYGIFSKTMTATLQMALNQATQVFDVNVVTA